MSHFLYNQDCSVLIKGLVDRDHHAHLHQGLDHFTGFDCHQLGQVSHGYHLRHLDLPNDGLGGPGKTVFGGGRTAAGDSSRGFAFFFLAPLSFLGSAPGSFLAGLFLGFPPGSFFLGLACLFLGSKAGFFFGLHTSFLLALRPCLILSFPAVTGFLQCLYCLLALWIRFFFFFKRLALYVGSTLAEFDIDSFGSCTWAAARNAQLADRFALQGDLARRRRVIVRLAMAGTQVGKQLFLVVIRDRVIT